MVIKKTFGEKVFDWSNYILMAFIMLFMLYPFYFVLCASVSNSYEVIASGGILLWPKGFNLMGYELVLKNPNVVSGYLNTIYYVVVGTTINILLTLLASYILSRKWMYGKNILMMFIIFTMFFNGGMIPNYLLVRNLGLIDSRWALLLPGAISVWNIIIMRTYMNGIPDSMEESAKIDGANDFKVLFSIILPLSIPTVAVNILFYAVAHWNSWFSALIYLKSKNLFPLQMFLREILVMSNMVDMTDQATQSISENIKYSTIIVATLPILCIYPFLQKYFVKGMMVGAVKG